MTTLAWYDWAGGRKFVMGMTALTMGFVLALAGKLGAEFTAILIAITAFFSGANVLTTMAALKAGPTPPAAAASTEGI